MAQVTTPDIQAIWPVVAPKLAKAVYYSAGRTDLRSVYQALQTSMQLLWIAYDDTDMQIAAAFTTRVAKYHKRQMLVIDCAGGGRMKDWLQIGSDTFRAYARDAGLGGVEMYGRPGWARVLKSCGWQQKLVVMETTSAPDEGV